MKEFLARGLVFFLISATSAAQLEKVLIEPDGVNTDVVLVEKDGKVLYESYARGYSKDTPHLSWSMAKTITGILIAQASVEYKFSLNDKVSQFIPEFKGDAKIIDVLQMSSGIEFTEDYFGLPVSSDVVKMLYLDGARMGASEYVKSLPLRARHKPGNHFFYSSGDTNLLMEILKKVIKNDLVFENYPWEKIFQPLGIEKVTFERDRNGIFIGSSYIYMKAEDFLKMGRLIVNRGKWDHKQIVPEFYMDLLHRVSFGVEQTALQETAAARAYSVQATTNLPIAGRNLPSEYESLPTDSILFLGHQGQLIAASPSQKLVIVRLAMDKGARFKREDFFTAVKELILKTDRTYVTAQSNENSPRKVETVKSSRIGKLNILELVNIPQLIRSFTAKEFCSCRFVVGRSHEACYADIALTMPVMPQIHISGGAAAETKTVKTQFFIGDETSAEFTGKKFGCRLIN